MAFCDFCDCKNCREGASWLGHAQTADGRWICDVCYQYDVCVTAKEKLGDRSGPCENFDCEHRPKLATPFISLERKAQS
jgi:hypothetical protein